MAVLIEIDDPADPRIAMFRMRDRGLNTRADRRESAAGRSGAGMFVAEGDLVVERALAVGCTPIAAFVDSADPPPVTAQLGTDVQLYGGGVDVRRTGMGLGVPLSIVALFNRPPARDPLDLVDHRRVVALEAVDNPVNIGTVVRSAVALGWTGLLLDRTSADPLARRALRVSMGTAFALPFARTDSLVAVIERARHAGTLVVALTPAAGSMPLNAVLPAHEQRVMLVIGSERSGLSAGVLGAASVRATIPMVGGIDSMNAAAATAVACYALRPLTRGAREGVNGESLRW